MRLVQPRDSSRKRNAFANRHWRQTVTGETPGSRRILPPIVRRKAQLDQVRLLRVQALEALQGLVERQHVDALRLDRRLLGHRREVDPHRLAAALVPDPRPRVVDRHPPHGLRRDGEEMPPALPVGTPVHHAHEGFVHQRGRLESVVRTLAAHLLRRQPLQALVDHRHEPVERRRVPACQARSRTVTSPAASFGGSASDTLRRLAPPLPTAPGHEGRGLGSRLLDRERPTDETLQPGHDRRAHERGTLRLAPQRALVVVDMQICFLDAAEPSAASGEPCCPSRRSISRVSRLVLPNIERLLERFRVRLAGGFHGPGFGARGRRRSGAGRGVATR
jgi:hypothetical protein